MRRVLVLALLLAGLISQDAFAVSETRALRLTVAGQDGSMNSFALYDKITAVVIGIDKYKSLDAKSYLKFAVRDAKGVEQVLRERYPVSKVITLYDEQATRDNIMKVLQGDLAGTDPDDAVIVFWAGHGITRSTAQRKLGYLIPYDGSLKDTEMHKNISMQQIQADISPLVPAKHMLFIMDACFGGILLSTRSAGLNPSHTSAYLEEITREQVRQIITAGGENQEVLDGGLHGHSVFTGRLIDALRNNQDFITAQQLGLELEQKVYGDARSRGHDQRPQVGKIYGTGDFVFVPDFEKRKKQAEGDTEKIEAEMQELERLKAEAVKRQDEAKLRALEQQRVLKEAELTKARLQEEAAVREATLRRKAEEDLLKDKAEQERQAKEREERLARLKIQAEKMKEELGSPASALGINDAAKEIKRLNTMIEKLEAEFGAELQKQLAPIQGYYFGKIVNAVNQPGRDKFETEADYKRRTDAVKAEAAKLEQEQKEKETAVKGQLMTILGDQLKSLEAQRKTIMDMRFPVGHKDIKWIFGKYDPDKQKFRVSGSISNITGFVSDISVPKEKAREYSQNPELLAASADLTVSDIGEPLPEKLTLRGPDGDEYSSLSIMGMVFVKGGCFDMGCRGLTKIFCNAEEDDRPVHKVCVSDFFIDATEVTQRAYRSQTGKNPSYFKGYDNCPVGAVTWDEAKTYCEKRGKRLPTEAEWEYAARSGGKGGKYAGGDNVDLVAWYEGNSGGKTHPVGQKSPNGLGIYDMSGNVFEWCSDMYDKSYYGRSPRDNPTGPLSSSGLHVIRGGSWSTGEFSLYSSTRSEEKKGARFGDIGFRCVATP